MSSHTIRHTADKIQRRLRLIEPLVHRQQNPLPPFRFKTLLSPETPPEVNADTSAWESVEPHTFWGGKDVNFQLAAEFTIPAEWDKTFPVALFLPLGESGDFSHPEALAYIDGEAFAACDRHHQEILLRDEWRGKSHRLFLHGWTGALGATWLKEAPMAKLYMRQCAVVQIDPPTREFIAAVRVALGVVKDISPDQPEHDRLLNALNDAFNLLDIREPFGEAFYASVPPALAALRDGIGAAGLPIDADIIATGHAHIDVAWLWTLGQTRRKAGRTFHTVLRLMEQFPEYHFTQSQPQLYEYVRQDYPELFDAIRERIADGRWEPIGAMWIESDCNITGGESLVRQLLLGTSFFREHFGEEAASPVLWLPDVFGYAWNLPQLIKLAGLEYFFTIKIGWNQYNRIPYDSFWWQGLDGTKVLTHFSTTPEHHDIRFKATYNANLSPRAAIGTWLNSQQKDTVRTYLMSYGWGDGGGGPTREMLEAGREMAIFPAAPRVQQGSVIDFFRRLEAESGDKVPTWNGELYLELHRGTYTTQARNKRANRKSEFLLHDAEFLATLASLLQPDYQYPHDLFVQIWRLICLNQFHDILPGSSIGQVYVESLEQYAEIRHLAETARDEALCVIAETLEGDLIVLNPTSFSWLHELALWNGKLEDGQCLKMSGSSQPMVTQSTADGTWIRLDGIPPYGMTSLAIEDCQPSAIENQFTVTPLLLENSRLRVELNEDGDITRIFDKDAQRDILPPGVIANQFQAFEDRPLGADAWDIDIFYDDKMWTSEPASSVEVVEAGPLHATLEIKRRILNSDYTQRISLSYDSRCLDFDTTIMWQEKHIMLKVAFPVDLLSPVATYEIQWGNVQRPTHRNTSWDWARFETCAQKWVDLSEGDYGVSLLNDCKYGHDIHDNVMRISLLRSPTSPDPNADQGEHTFRYSLLHHYGSIADVAGYAYRLNDPLIITEGRGGKRFQSSTDSSLVAMQTPNCIIETVKQAEDGGGIIVRFYEHLRTRGIVTLRAGFPIRGAYITNLLEENQEQLLPQGNTVSLYVKPFQIVTLRLIPEAE